jgi:SAM-dependent methyltransferase
VATLAPARGDRFLDLACGTGGVALIAARAAAEVTGIDISPDQLSKARAAATEAGLAIRFDEGDVEELPYDEASFDVAASAFGMIFASDHARAAAELSRVCRSGARIALTSWFRDDWADLGARLRPDYEGVASWPWSDEAYVSGLLPDFELGFERGGSTIAADSAEALWELLAASVPPLKAWLEGLDEAGREHARAEYLPLLSGGELTREYLLVLGTRR